MFMINMVGIFRQHQNVVDQHDDAMLFGFDEFNVLPFGDFVSDKLTFDE